MITIPEGFSVVIRSCKTGGISRDGFVWPTEIGAEVECSDWSPEPICGQGLFGLLPGQNDPGVWYGDLVLALLVKTQTIVNLGGKVKFPRAQILFSGTNPEAHAWLESNKLNGFWYRSTQTAGDRSTQTAGCRSTQTAGDGSVAIAGPGSKQKATNSLLVCRWYDHNESKYKFATAIAGVDVEDDVFYTYDVDSATWQKAEVAE